MAPTSSATLTARFANDWDRWQAVVVRDLTADGAFVYSVKTTGVYCRPHCAARRANRVNVGFHRTPADAERAGFRACRRCKPDAPAVTPHAEAVARACKLIEGSPAVPSLQTLADLAGLSTSHFHRAFKSLTGLTPKAYAAACRNGKARSALGEGDSVTRAIYQAGYQSSSCFYATADQALGMKPAAFRAGGRGVTIRFAIGQCELGKILVAASGIGICAITFGDEPGELVADLRRRFPNATVTDGDRDFERVVATVVAFVERPAIGLSLPLDIRGTAFQQRVWKALSEIAAGKTCSYAQVAAAIGAPRAVRAVASACAANALAVAIPCHRVVHANGAVKGYRWGTARKVKLLERESKGGPD